MLMNTDKETIQQNDITAEDLWNSADDDPNLASMVRYEPGT
jgi:hypothetical protein